MEKPSRNKCYKKKVTFSNGKNQEEEHHPSGIYYDSDLGSLMFSDLNLIIILKESISMENYF